MVSNNYVLFLILFLFSERIVELIIAGKNESWIRTQGGIEYDRKFSQLIIFFHIIWFSAFILEAYYSRAVLLVSIPTLLFVTIALQAWRYWCIFSLGKFWNTKIIILPGADICRKGPYRWFKHPNYFVVLIEIPLYPALFGCWSTAIIGGLLNVWLLRKRIAQENRELSVLTYKVNVKRQK